jgi:hypothetical protein
VALAVAMKEAVMTSNRHAADRLHEVRVEIKALETEVDELRSYLQEHPEDLVGDEYCASIGSYRRRCVDWEGLEREIGKAVLQRFTSFKLIAVVRLREREREDA